MRVGALPILPTTGSPVLSTETGGQRVFMKILKEEKGESLHPWDKAHLVMYIVSYLGSYLCCVRWFKTAS